MSNNFIWIEYILTIIFMYKPIADKYKTKNGKLYISHIFVWDVDGVFSNWIPNTKEARQYIQENFPEIKDYILVKSQDFYWYVVFIYSNDVVRDIKNNRVNKKKFIFNQIELFNVSLNNHHLIFSYV